MAPQELRDVSSAQCSECQSDEIQTARVNGDCLVAAVGNSTIHYHHCQHWHHHQQWYYYIYYCNYVLLLSTTFSTTAARCGFFNRFQPRVPGTAGSPGTGGKGWAGLPPARDGRAGGARAGSFLFHGGDVHI